MIGDPDLSVGSLNDFDPHQKLSFDDWIHVLDTAVIQLEYGYMPGEFTVYPELWRAAYDEGLSPHQAWERALAASDDERKRANERKDAAYRARVEHEAKFGY